MGKKKGEEGEREKVKRRNFGVSSAGEYMRRNRKDGEGNMLCEEKQG